MNKQALDAQRMSNKDYGFTDIQTKCLTTSDGLVISSSEVSNDLRTEYQTGLRPGQ